MLFLCLQTAHEGHSNVRTSQLCALAHSVGTGSVTAYCGHDMCRPCGAPPVALHACAAVYGHSTRSSSAASHLVNQIPNAEQNDSFGSPPSVERSRIPTHPECAQPTRTHCCSAYIVQVSTSCRGNIRDTTCAKRRRLHWLYRSPVCNVIGPAHGSSSWTWVSTELRTLCWQLLQQSQSRPGAAAASASADVRTVRLRGPGPPPAAFRRHGVPPKYQPSTDRATEVRSPALARPKHGRVCARVVTAGGQFAVSRPTSAVAAAAASSMALLTPGSRDEAPGSKACFRDTGFSATVLRT